MAHALMRVKVVKWQDCGSCSFVFRLSVVALVQNREANAAPARARPRACEPTWAVDMPLDCEVAVLFDGVYEFAAARPGQRPDLMAS